MRLQVKCIIVCGHYNCGAVKGALKMPTTSCSLVNHWIADIRQCRNEHGLQLKRLPDKQQLDRCARALLQGRCDVPTGFMASMRTAARTSRALQ